MSNKTSWIVSILITIFLILLVVGGYSLGQKMAFKEVGKVTRKINTATTLFFHWHRHTEEDLDSEVLLKRYAKLYELENVDREFVQRVIDSVMWEPALAPAPFIGHKPKQDQNGLAHVNSYGFRDQRENLSQKEKGIYRIFLTGGSTAFGTGAKSDNDTVAGYLEEKLNREMSPISGVRYQVINTAVPAWTTTQEEILISTRLVDLKPDMIIMLSGNNDIHWSMIESEDPAYFWPIYDRNFVLLLNNTFKKLGYVPEVVDMDLQKGDTPCSRTLDVVSRNIKYATTAAIHVGAQLVFALQPNMYSSGKQLSESETKFKEKFLGRHQIPVWGECYDDYRSQLPGLKLNNYSFVDLSQAFKELTSDQEVFIDAYHFANLGNKTVADQLFSYLKRK